ncbi:MAG: acetylxylan esterase [Clostridia bacterium]|nr:acetylxylan esterase [Clostridia bacterium]
MKTTYEFLKEKMQTVKPSFSYPGNNYDEWKTAARKRLRELICIDKLEPAEPDVRIEYEKDIGSFKETRFTFQSEEGYRIPCHLLVSENAERPPLMICLQGHSPGMHLSLGRPKNESESEFIKNEDGDYALIAVKNGFAALTVEQRNFGELGGTYCFPSAMTDLLMGRTTIGDRVFDIMRAIDVMENSFSDCVDTGLISIMGHSGGGTAAAYTAALEDRIKLVVCSCAMASFKDSIGAIEHCACNYVPGIANVFDMSDLMAMACPKYFVQVSGLKDDIFPYFAAEIVFNDGKGAYEENGAEDCCALVKGPYGHRFYADETYKVVKRFLGT